MNIEKKYFTQSKQIIKDIEESVRKYRESLTEAELTEANKRTQIELENMINRFNEKMENAPEPVIDKEKVLFFQELSRQAIRMAKDIQADIKISTESRIKGDITLTTDFILLDSELPTFSRLILCNLIMTANDICISASDNLTEFSFSFDLCI